MNSSGIPEGYGDELSFHCNDFGCPICEIDLDAVREIVYSGRKVTDRELAKVCNNVTWTEIILLCPCDKHVFYAKPHYFAQVTIEFERALYQETKITQDDLRQTLLAIGSNLNVNSKRADASTIAPLVYHHDEEKWYRAFDKESWIEDCRHEPEAGWFDVSEIEGRR